jgi:tetratricopeptide (TPR) repeat protein
VTELDETAAATEEAQGELSLARVALAEDDLGHAANHVSGAIAMAPWLPETYELLAALAARAPDGGLALFPLDSGYLGTVVAHAHLLGGRDPDGALDLLSKATNFDPNKPWADAPWVRALDLGRGDAAALTRVFVTVMQRLDDPAPEPARRANEVYLDLARRAVARHPDSALLHAVAAGLARRFGELELAVAWGERGYRLEATKMSATWYAYALRAAGRLDDAIAVMDSARRQNPLDLDLCADMSSWLAHAGRLDEALATIEDAMRIDPTYDCAVHTAHRLRFQRDGDPRHLIALNDFIREHPVDSHDHSDLAQACDRQPWLGWPGSATEAVINALGQGSGGFLTMSLSALEVPSAIAVLRRACPDIDLTISGDALPGLTEPRRPGPVLWRYDGVNASPAVAPPALASTALLAETTQPWWAHPIAAYDRALPLGQLSVAELLALLVYPPVCPSDWADRLPPGWWERSAQAYACLGLLHSQELGPASAAGRELLTQIAYGAEDWTTEAALFALTVAAWADPSCRVEVREVVGRRFLDAVTDNRERVVTIVDSLAHLARMTPDMPDELLNLAKDFLALRAATPTT